MALQRDTRYPGRFTTGNSAHPQGAFKNRSAPGALDGSYIEQDWANDWDGYFGSLLGAAGITANGSVDAVGASQYYTALRTLLNAASPTVGSVRGGKMVIAAASASGTYTADELVVETALGGQTYRLASFSKTINLATTGAGGMDTGTAPVNGYVALYAIYNPTTLTSALLAFNSTSSVAPSVYGGANMPSGYTASALLTVLPTNGSSLFKIALVKDRSVFLVPVVMFTNNSTVTNQVVSISGVVPQNARDFSGQLFMSSTAGSVLSLAIQPDTTTVGQFAQSVVVGATAGMSSSYTGLPVATVQQFVVTTSSSAGTPTFTVYSSGYSI